MLCQLVCVDRRYQRMNCFNIRELQGILKRKFFTDLVNTSDIHSLSEPTLIGMRHKNNMSNILLYDQSLFYNFDITKTSKFKNYSFEPGKVYTYLGYSYNSSNGLLLFTNNLNIVNYITYFTVLLRDFVSFICVPNLPVILNSIFSSFFYISRTISNSFYVVFDNTKVLNRLFYYLQINPNNSNSLG
jgi:hypothetical protein